MVPCQWAFGEKSWCLPPASAARDAAEIASAEQCRIHILDVPAALGRSLHPMCTPCGWEWHQYAMEVWLDRAVRRWPNLVSRVEDAELVVVSGADFGRWCTATMQIVRTYTRSFGGSSFPAVHRASDFAKLLDGKAHKGARFQLCKDGRAGNDTMLRGIDGTYRRRRVVGGVYDQALGGFAEERADGQLLLACTDRTKRELWRRLTQQRVFELGLPTLVVATNTECATPWMHEKLLPRSVLLVKDRPTNAPRRRGDVVAPFSVSSPAWLAWRGVALRSATSNSADVDVTAATGTSTPASAAASAAASASASAATIAAEPFSSAAQAAQAHPSTHPSTHTPPLPRLPWHERQPLLFFAGYAPKLQPCVFGPTTVCTQTCNRTYAPIPATVCMHPGLQPCVCMHPGTCPSCTWPRTSGTSCGGRRATCRGSSRSPPLSTAPSVCCALHRALHRALRRALHSSPHR